MNTPAHLLIGAALFGGRDNTKILAAALIGGFLPDLSLYLLAGVSIFVLNIPPQVVFDDLYFSPAWQLIFSVDNSFIIWGVLFALAFKYRHAFFIALTSAALLHLVCDFGLHHDDARAHFWPLSNWKFASPLSYWDSNHHSFYVAPVEGIVTAAATVFLIMSKLHPAIKTGLLILFFVELFTLSSWLRHF